MEVGGQRHAPAALPLAKRLGTPCVGGWVGPRAGLEGGGKSRLPPGFDLRTVLPVLSRCTDWAIRANNTPLLRIRMKSASTYDLSSVDSDLC
jgi:hypothetical protein